MIVTCSACREEIRWALTSEGLRVPIDIPESPDGQALLAPEMTPHAFHACPGRDDLGRIVDFVLTREDRPVVRSIRKPADRWVRDDAR